tara:strand:+ start:16576 stop:16803 length:228 start_codon:yes stop_codon:yes gene_type:complete
MDCNNYRQLLLRERFSKDLNQDDYEDTLKHYAELYYKEKVTKIVDTFTKGDDEYLESFNDEEINEILKVKFKIID